MTANQFVDLAFKGFSLGFGIGFALWSFSYAIRMIRKSFTSAMRIVDV